MGRGSRGQYRDATGGAPPSARSESAERVAVLGKCFRSLGNSLSSPAALLVGEGLAGLAATLGLAVELRSGRKNGFRLVRGCGVVVPDDVPNLAELRGTILSRAPPADARSKNRRMRSATPVIDAVSSGPSRAPVSEQFRARFTIELIYQKFTSLSAYGGVTSMRPPRSITAGFDYLGRSHGSVE
jgi:hypothetical protein